MTTRPSPSQPVDKIVVTPAFASPLDTFNLRQRIDLLQEQIYQLTMSQDEGAGKKVSTLKDELIRLEQELHTLTSISCYFGEDQIGDESYFEDAVKNLNEQLSKCNAELSAIETLIAANCGQPEIALNCLTKPPRNGNQEQLLTCLEKLNHDLKSQPNIEQQLNRTGFAGDLQPD